MKLTPENADYQDSRPPTGEIDMEMVPAHMRERVAARKAAREAAATSERKERAALSLGKAE